MLTVVPHETWSPSILQLTLPGSDLRLGLVTWQVWPGVYKNSRGREEGPVGLRQRLCAGIVTSGVWYFLRNRVTPVGTVGSQSDFPDLDSRDSGHNSMLFTSFSGRPRLPWQAEHGSPVERSKAGHRCQDTFHLCHSTSHLLLTKAQTPEATMGESCFQDGMVVNKDPTVPDPGTVREGVQVGGGCSQPVSSHSLLHLPWRPLLDLLP